MRIVRYTYPNSRLSVPGAFDRSPWSGLESEIDRLFNTALSDFMGTTPAADRFPVDLYEDSDNAYVRADLPGLTRDDINVEVVEGYLNIEAARKTKEGDQEESFRFRRSITLPDDVRADAVTATYENGVLSVILPKKEEAKPRKISVSVK
jgi:HSP20 family protein